MKTPCYPKAAGAILCALLSLFLGPTLAQAKRYIDGQVFIVTKGGENVKLGLVPIWVLGDSEMTALAKQAMELANAAAQKQKVEQAVKDLRKLEAKAEKELSSAGAQKVKAASSEEMQALLKSLEPISAQVERGGKLLEKIDKQKRGVDSGEIFSRVILGSELAVKMLIGMLSEKESDVESDADGKFKLSVENSGGWVVAYSQRTAGHVGQLDVQNLEQYYWVVELPQKKAQLFLSSYNCDLSEAEVRLRSLAVDGGRSGFWGGFQHSVTEATGSVHEAGRAQKVYDEKKTAEELINAESARTMAADKAEKERIAMSESKALQAKAVAEGKMLLDESGFSYILVPEGVFQMGAENEPNSPVHSVKVGGFFVGETEVSYGAWCSVYAWSKAKDYVFKNEGNGASQTHPVTDVNWYDVVKWCNAKSEKEGLTPCYKVNGSVYRKGEIDEVDCDWTANGYRLPTEAEWEKAARGGLVGKKYPNGDWLSNSANYRGSGTREVGDGGTNGYGLRYMAGNVAEWCWDWEFDKLGKFDHLLKNAEDPKGPDRGSFRVRRGGSWSTRLEVLCAVYRRGGNSPSFGSAFDGFRLVRRL